MHWYKFNIADYKKRTTHLSLLEHAIYRALIDTYYLTEKPLMLDKAQLMRLHCIRSADEKEAFEIIINEFFEETDGGFLHRHCQEELSKIYAKSEKCRQAAQKRWGNNADAMHMHSEEDADGVPPITHNPLSITQDYTHTQPVPIPPDLELVNIQYQAAKEYFDAKGVTVDIKECFERFKAHHLSKGTMACSWSAMWQIWYMDEKSRKRAV